MEPKLPPHSPEAERAILGCILQDPQQVLDACGDRIADTEAFFEIRNRRIYEASIQLLQEGKPVELVSLMEKLRVDGNISIDASYLGLIMTEAPPASSVSFYIEIVLEKYAARRLISLASSAIEKAYSATSTEIGGLLSSFAAEAADVADTFSAAGESSVTYKQAVMRAIDMLNERWKLGGALSGLGTGLNGIDQLLSGLHPGELIVVGARPSQGKTALGIGIADQVALSGPNRVLIFSLEMPADQLAMRSLGAIASVNVRKVMSGVASERDFKALVSAAARLSKTQTTIEDMPGLRMGQIAARARKIHRRTPLSLIVVDYLQLVEPDQKLDKRNEEVDAIAKGLKNMARELNVPVIALCQLNRDSDRDSRRPRMSDLRDSSGIESAADIVCLIHQKPPPSDKPSDIWDAELIIAKQRNGATGDIRVKFNRPFVRFEDVPMESVPQSF